MAISNHKDLIVWQQSMQLTSDMYKIARQLSNSEQFILISQILRAAISIPSNISEGFGRHTKPELIRFLNISLGSAYELETQLLIIQKEYPNILINQILLRLNSIQKMLWSLANKNAVPKY